MMVVFRKPRNYLEARVELELCKMSKRPYLYVFVTMAISSTQN